MAPSTTRASRAPSSGFWLKLAVLDVALAYAGVAVVFGRRQTFRFGGVLALIGAAFLALLFALYVRRPTNRRR